MSFSEKNVLVSITALSTVEIFGPWLIHADKSFLQLLHTYLNYAYVFLIHKSGQSGRVGVGRDWRYGEDRLITGYHLWLTDTIFINH